MRVGQPSQERPLATVADIRFVLVRSVGKLRPGRGLILDWKGQGRSREALVVYFDDAALRPVRKMEWIAKSDLIPVPVG